MERRKRDSKDKTERNISHTEVKKFMNVFSSGMSATYANVSALKKQNVNR